MAQSGFEAFCSDLDCWSLGFNDMDSLICGPNCPGRGHNATRITSSFTNTSYKVSGQWPFQSTAEKIILRSFVVLTMFSILIPMMLFLKKMQSLDGIITCLPPILFQLANLIKLINCIINSDKMKMILIKMRNNWNSDMDALEVEILGKYAEEGRRLTIGYAAYWLWTYGTFIITPLMPQIMDIVSPLNITRQKRNLFAVEFYVDPQKYFYLILLHGLVALFVATVSQVAVDSMYAVYVQHACGMFATLRARLERLSNKKKSKLDGYLVESHDGTFDDVVFCVNKHRSSIEFSNLIESSYMISFSFVIVLTILFITIAGVKIVVKLEEIEFVVRLAAANFAQMVHLFYNSWPGQKLIDHSSYISDSVYNGEWYDIPLKSRRLLSLMMLRSSVPCKITAGKLYVLSFESFSVFIKTSLSYFTVLLSFR